MHEHVTLLGPVEPARNGKGDSSPLPRMMERVR
jgi:hypothetical protein